MPDNAIMQPPSAWAEYSPILAGLVRLALGVLGGAGFAWANSVTGSQIEMAVSAAMMLGAGVWSAYQKVSSIREARRLAASAAVVSAELSAERGVPTPVIPPSPPGTTAKTLNDDELERIRQGGRV